MGIPINVSENTVALDDMHDEIEATILYTRTFADEMQETLALAIADLQNIVGTYNPPLITVDTDIPDMDQPVFPSSPSIDDYVSTIWDILFTKVTNDIINGGSGLSNPVYNAIVAREQEARRLNQDREYRKALDGVGSQGFDLPSGHVAAVQVEMGRELLSRDQDALNNLQIKDFDLATENTRFAVTTGLELEKLLREAWVANVNATVDIFKAETDGIAAKYAALADWAKVQIEGIKIEAEVAIKNGELGLTAYNASVALAEKIAEAIAGIATQSIASALGAINTSMSNSYSGSENRGESWGHSENLSESHSFTES